MSEAARLDFGRLERIAVFRALQLGDLLVTVPALRALRMAAPRAEITLVGLPWARGFAQRYAHLIDGFLEFPGFPGLPETEPRLDALPDFYRAAQGKRFDLALQMHGSGALTNPLMVAMGARRNAGYMPSGGWQPDAGSFLDWRSDEHEVLRYLRLLEALGAPPQGQHLEFPITAEDRAHLSRDVPELPAPLGYVCVHPGARLPSRRWPVQRFAEVADALAADGWRIVLTGSGDEKPLVAEVAAAMHAPAIDTSGRTSLGGLAAMIAGARLLVSNDTGVSHVAAAVGTQSVVVSSGADARRWAPLDAAKHRMLWADVPCRPCAHVVCPIGHPCALGVTVNAVLEQVNSLCQLQGATAA
ncbi:glycosyltransferase family 9 protein [Noviherbaspirillum pedocola]|uniref:Glycosyltransferase family 9 protein n=1 Tax=Noviherbaspirillum pedocola TaxID=2801341 RepID=A0A934SUV2_9BURK|nr:glycosyltransferase family 9 protein [Noviherbaspirillum pedocola]MBK4735591.1 glycosyltransferase family 9 protein [Noviherbaspirillum pedocola]